MKSWMNKSVVFISPTAMCLLLSGCLFGENKTFFDYNTATNGSASEGSVTLGAPHLAVSTPTPSPSATPTASATPVASSTPTATATPNATAVTTESFNAATSEVKKIDFLFVVDNSGSMADNQAKLAEGFEKFANTFYRRADLDICTAIITTDRYLGKVGNYNYQRERTLPCTKTSNWNTMSADAQKLYIDHLIAEFKIQVNVGTNGSGNELVGKSIVSYLYSLSKWSETINTGTHTSFFRSDAVANISILTDENNWFYNNPEQMETMNDLPAIQNSPIYNSRNGAIDTRKGIKNYLDDFFSAVQPSHGLSYSITSFLEVTQPATTIPGLAMNLTSLNTLVGRESAKSDIEGNADSFANVYHGLADSIVSRASALNLVHTIYEPLFPSVIADLEVSIVKPDQTKIILSYGSNYSVLLPNGILINQATSNTTSSGDHFEVHYRYQTNH